MFDIDFSYKLTLILVFQFSLPEFGTSAGMVSAGLMIALGLFGSSVSVLGDEVSYLMIYTIEAY